MFLKTHIGYFNSTKLLFCFRQKDLKAEYKLYFSGSYICINNHAGLILVEKISRIARLSQKINSIIKNDVLIKALNNVIC